MGERTHGTLGRLILCQAHGDWWVVNDADLELSLVCGPPDMVTAIAGGVSYESFSWLPDPTVGASVVEFYSL